MHFCPTRRIPRAGLDPISDADAALSAVALAMHLPFEHETIALLLDHERRGITITLVTGTHEPDAAVGVIECLAQAGGREHRLGAVVLASIRPDGGPLSGDADRWLEMSDIAETFGIELLEWFIVGHDISCPRDLLGESPRW